ncbi:AAA family ATPase [Marinigracilibium pacificum]|uniref:AAA domain-containing protein n=1 Tax=Marinigracilibium pacificum TaxID=2729599 RepID=A0A848IQT0_9BACT|nr:AAA family ATPase [Marinigracilibium pacificum]NMM46813.1 AAA domain-containing protein [Marinigracilibium pacificum]
MEKFNSDKEAAEALQKAFSDLKSEIGKVIIGQEKVVDLLLISIFSQGHSLLVGVPGLAKTLLIHTIADALHLSFNRIQFTPDLMPSDILGAETLDKDRNFRFIKGPVFANIVLADEINRTPPKTQAALLESMQEHQVTVGGQKYSLPEPFFVLATQNPIEQEGTYPLPEAQLDRFMFNIILEYPDYDSEVQIVKSTTDGSVKKVNPILSAEDIALYQSLVKRVPVTDHVIEYAVNLVHKTRPTSERADAVTKEYIEWGAGPRAGQYLILGAKCHALLHGKFAPDIEDVKAVATAVLRHRIVSNFKADAEELTNDAIIEKLL